MAAPPPYNSGPPPPHGPPPPYPPPPGQNTVVMMHPGVGGGGSAAMSPFPVRMVCNHCGGDIVTNTHTHPGTITWVACLILLLVFWPAMCVPFCCTSTQDVAHTCPRCGAMIALHRRM